MKQIAREEKAPMERVIRRVREKKEIPKEKLIERLPPVAPVEKKEEEVKEIEEEVKERVPEWMREKAPKEKVQGPGASSSGALQKIYPMPRLSPNATESTGSERKNRVLYPIHPCPHGSDRYWKE